MAVRSWRDATPPSARGRSWAQADAEPLALAPRVAAMRDAGHVAGFHVTPWVDIEDFYTRLCDAGATFARPMASLVRSVLDEGAAEKLAGHTSMHDLVITTTPVSNAPDSLRVSLIEDDRVRISHQAQTGPGDTIERTQAELLPLFWRFCIEKWGIHPARDFA